MKQVSLRGVLQRSLWLAHVVVRLACSSRSNIISHFSLKSDFWHLSRHSTSTRTENNTQNTISGSPVIPPAKMSVTGTNTIVPNSIVPRRQALSILPPDQIISPFESDGSCWSCVSRQTPCDKGLPCTIPVNLKCSLTPECRLCDLSAGWDRMWGIWNEITLESYCRWFW